MNKLHLVFLIGMGLLIFHLPGHSQSIKRSVISSMGASQIGPNGIRLRSTTAQAPNAGTISNDNYYLRQGFQQPNGCNSAPIAVFDYQNTSDGNCASPFQFNYLGSALETSTFLWDFGEGANPDSSNLQQPPVVLYENTGIKEVSLTVSTGNCTSTLSIELEVDQTPIITQVQTQDLICREDQDGMIDLNIQGGTEPYMVTWADGAVGIQRTNLAPGEYIYELNDANVCIQKDTLIIEGPDSLRILSSVINESCEGTMDGSIVLEVLGGSPPYTYEWSNNSVDPNQIALSAGEYSVLVSDDNKCEQSLLIEVANNCGSLTIYDLFTPNGDGQNDTWFIEGIEKLLDNELQIFDRWGRLVFSTQGYTGDWDGRSTDGKELPFGAYYYILQLNDLNNTIYKGAVSILR